MKTTRSMLAVAALIGALSLAAAVSQADPVTVPNAGFEARASFDPFGDGIDKYLINMSGQEEIWRQFDVSSNGGPIRIWNPSPTSPGVSGAYVNVAPAFGGTAPDGDYVAAVYTRYDDPARDFEAVAQLLTEPFDPTMTYTLTAEVGRLPAGFDPYWNGYAVQLVAGGTNVNNSGRYSAEVEGGTVIAQDNNSLTVPADSFVTSTVVYTPDPADAGLAGLPLQIRLCALEDTANRGGLKIAVFDAVTLDATAAGGPIDVAIPNGSFEELYKPGTAIAGQVSPGGWTKGVGPNCEIDSGSYQFSDNTTGNFADIPGWVGYDRAGWVALGGTYSRDQTTGNLQGSVARQGPAADGDQYYLSNGGGWGNSAGGLIVSDAPLGTVEADGTYVLTMMARGWGATSNAQPPVLELLVDGVVMTPTSSVDPTLSADWQEFIRTYDADSLRDHLGKPLAVMLGVGRNATGTQSRFDDVSLSYTVPEPATMALLSLAACGLGGYVRRRRRA